MEKEQLLNIAPKYIDMVKRFQSIPNTRKNIKRVKMILDFVSWYRKNEKTLTDDEKIFLQNNIYNVHESDFYVSHA